MGLFTNNKKLCPICGSPTPRLLASAVEGQNLCKECAAKIDLPDGVFNSMTLDDFREYIKCYDANKPLRDSFTETYRYDFGFFKGSLVLDMDHQLLRLGVVDGAFAMEPSDIKSFRILEDGEVLYEGEKGFVFDTKTRYSIAFARLKYTASLTGGLNVSDPLQIAVSAEVLAPEQGGVAWWPIPIPEYTTTPGI